MRSSSFTPAVFFTSSPLGRPAKKFGTPLATKEGMSLPRSLSTPPTSLAKSLRMSLLFLYVLVGAQCLGEGAGVISGCSTSRAPAPGCGAARTAEHTLNKKRAVQTMVRSKAKSTHRGSADGKAWVLNRSRSSEIVDVLERVLRGARGSGSGPLPKDDVTACGILGKSQFE